MAKFILILLAIALSITAVQTHAAIITVDAKLTAKGVGFTPLDDVEINYLSDGNPVEADRLGLITSPAVGKGSILTILENGLAGVPDSNLSMMVTVTAQARTDNFPTTKDYRGGILTLSEQKGKSSDHLDKDEGLGVRAYTVIEGPWSDPNTGLRQIDPTTGRARIEGSKEVSGGIDEKHGPIGGPIDPNNANGPDHVDEIVYFDFNQSEVQVEANSFGLRFTKFETGKDYLTLTVTLTDDSNTTLSNISAADKMLFSDQGSNVWDLSFSGINTYLGTSFLDDNDVLKQVTVRAVEVPTDGQKSHFLINGFSATAPEPATLSLLALGGLALLKRRRKH